MPRNPSKILAIIPGRGGSKGIPRKNLLPLRGKPLIAHTIEHALTTAAIVRTVVSTEDDGIANLALMYGAEVIRRPLEISTDDASSESALVHVLDTLRASENWEPDVVVFLQATSPLRQPGTLASALEMFEREHADSLMSVGPLHGFLWTRERDGTLRPVNYDPRDRPRRQDAVEQMVENGSFYIFRPQILRATGARLGGKIVAFKMSARESIQIDEADDVLMLEALWNVDDAPPPLDVRLIVFDFDGVLTDNRVLVEDSGTESVVCSRADGWGFNLIREQGIHIAVLSTEVNPVVSARCKKLQVECVQGCTDKAAAIKELARLHGLTALDVAFVGNDTNDVPALRWVGWPIAVADAEGEAKAAAKYVTQRPGGFGVAREIASWVTKVESHENRRREPAPRSSVPSKLSRGAKQ